MVGDWKADAIDIDPLDVTCSRISDTQVSCVIGTNSVEQTLTLEGAKVTHDRTGREGTYDGIGLITWPKLDYKRAITWTKQGKQNNNSHN